MEEWDLSELGCCAFMKVWCENYESQMADRLGVSHKMVQRVVADLKGLELLKELEEEEKGIGKGEKIW